VARTYVVHTGAITLVAAQAKCVLEITASATCGLTIVALEFLFSRSVITTTSASVEWSTFGTTGSGTAVTPQQWGTGQGLAAIVTACKVNNSAAPTTLVQGGLPTWRIPLPGSYSVQFPSGREMFMPASAKWCLMVNQQDVSGTPTPQGEVRVNLFFEQG
jgi:hypothetical protein